MNDRANIILVLGSFVVGQTIRCERLPVAGETLLGTDFDFGPGGKGFNQAVACARMGATVRLTLPLGDDWLAAVARDAIASESLTDVRVLAKPGSQTGVGFVTLLSSGENTILVAPGINAQITAGDLGDIDALLDGVGLVVSQMEIPISVTQAVFERARRRGVRTMLNPAPGRPLPAELLRLCDVLTPNETEARLILGLGADDPTPTESLIAKLRSLVVKLLVITRGAHGAIVVDGDRVHIVPSHQVTSVDPTGAGDSFNAAFAVSLAEGLSPVDAARRGCAAGALATQTIGVINAIPTRAQVDELIRKDAR